LPANDLRRFAVPSANSCPHPAHLPRSGPRLGLDRGLLGPTARGRARRHRGDGEDRVEGGRGTMTLPRRDPIDSSPRRSDARRRSMGTNRQAEGGPPCGPTDRAGATGLERRAGRSQPATLPSMPSEGDASKAMPATRRAVVR
jgi:hypothetical protein